MPSKIKTCGDYRTALMDAAAEAVQPSLELRSHLDACASCNAAFAEELQLFSAIDLGLRTTANAEVPPSFLPRVGARLDIAQASQRGWTPFLIFATASAAIVLTVFIAARPRRAVNDPQTQEILSTPSHAMPETPKIVIRREAAGTPAIAAANGSQHTPQRRNSAPASPASPIQLGVLVPSDEREAFVRFVSTRQERSDVAIAVVAPAAGHEDAPLSVEPLLIAKLEVTPLEQLESSAPDNAQEEQ